MMNGKKLVVLMFLCGKGNEYGMRKHVCIYTFDAKEVAAMKSQMLKFTCFFSNKKSTRRDRREIYVKWSNNEGGLD